jgi:hypothetical protein
MPALTHGRVKNGFNQFPRTISFGSRKCKDKSGNTLERCQKAVCCGKPIQPTKYKISSKTCNRGLCRVPSRTTATRDRAIATGGIGSRSFGTKRAIARRVNTRNQLPLGSSKWWRAAPITKGFDKRSGMTYAFGDECKKSTCNDCCLPTFPSVNPINVNFIKK